MSGYGKWHGSRMPCEKCGAFKEVQHLYLTMNVRCPACGEYKEIPWKSEIDWRKQK